MKKYIFLMVFSLSTLGVQAQFWNDDGNTGITPGTNFLGTIEDDPLDMRTEDIHRFRLLPDANYTIGGFPTQVKNGSLLLSPDVDQFYLNGANGPYSLLHIADADNNAQQASYRDWMHVGLTFTGNRDHGYIGQKHGEEFDFTDMVMHWSDNPTKWLKDRMRFIFTSGYNDQVATGANSLEGLEAMRLYPVDNDNVNVGLGDFYAGNIADPSNVLEPTERLDVLTGKVRIRQMPTDAVSTSNEYVTVNTTTGVLEHRPLPPSATPGCEWYGEPLPAFREVRSGLGNVGSAGSCPDRAWLYTIGQQGTLTSKFNIHFNGNERSGVNSGLNVNLITRTGAAGEHYGINVNVSPENGQSAVNAYGVRALVHDPGVLNTFGTWGKIIKTNSSSMANLHGAYGHVELSGGANGSTVYGTFGRSRLSGASFTSVYGAYASSEIDGSSAVGSSFGLDARSRIENGSTVANSWGVRATSSAPTGTISSISYGVQASGSNGGFQSIGVMGTAGGASGSKYGVYGVAGGSGTANYSVFGASPGSNTTDWAGYFPGRTHTPGGLWTTSDGSLKTGIGPIEDATAMINTLDPKAYMFDTAQFPSMGLPEGRQFGFIAEELQVQFPEMVIETLHPAVGDSLGNVIHEAIPFKAVNTNGITPILVAAFKEQYQVVSTQRSELDELRALVLEQRGRLDQMEALLAACCANPDGSRLQAPTNTTEPTLDDRGDDRKLRIVPNPFNESTTVYYTLERAGRTQLMANSADGRELRVLQEADLMTGDYQFQWNTAGLAPGMYYVTLLLDGQPVVKKGVKVTR